MKSKCSPRTAFNRRFLFPAPEPAATPPPRVKREREKKYHIYIKKKKKEYLAPSWLPSGTRERVELFRKEINKISIKDGKGWQHCCVVAVSNDSAATAAIWQDIPRAAQKVKKKKNSSNGASLRAAGNEDSNIIPLTPRQFSNRIQPDPYTTAAPQPDINKQTTTHLALNTLRPTERGRASHHTLYDWYFSISIFFLLFLFFSSSTSNKKKEENFIVV